MTAFHNLRHVVARAFCVVFTAVALQASPDITESTVLATVNDKKFTVLELQQVLQSIPPQMRSIPAERLIPLMIRAWVQEQLFLAEARKDGIKSHELYKKRMKSARMNALVSTYQELKAKELVTDKKIEDAYNKYIKENFEGKKIKERKIQYALFDSKAKADEALKLYKNKSLDMDEVVAKYSRDKAQNGVIGYVSDLHKGIPPEFRKEIKNVKEGDIRGPFKTRAGWNLVKCLEVRDMKKPSLSDQSQKLQQQVMAAEFEKHYEALKKKHKVKIEKVPGLTEPAKKP